jgi:LPS export ABC transporter protein LptC
VSALAANRADDTDARSPLLYPALALLALLAGWLAFEGFRDPGAAPAANEEQRPRYHIEAADWTRFDETGSRVFVVGASSIDYFDDASMQLADIALNTGDENGPWRLDARRGVVPAGEKRLRLEPLVDVRGRTRDEVPVQILAPTLWVDWAERTLSTDDAVDARAGSSTLQAVGMRTDWNGERVEFLGEVQVRHVPDN